MSIQQHLFTMLICLEQAPLFAVRKSPIAIMPNNTRRLKMSQTSSRSRVTIELQTGKNNNK